ncbi:UNVERIFIED_CONTAM: unc-22 [Trichonephila clavipes]
MSNVYLFSIVKPYIDRSNLDTITVKKGKVIKLEVNVRGEPPPTITWKLKDKVVKTENNVEVVSEDYKTNITINDAQRKDTGLYVIIAENVVGKDEAQVEFVVLDEPGAPGTPEIVDWDENHVDLKWTPPKNDGGAPITGYIIEKKERYGPGWEPCLTTQSPKPEAKVEGLQYGNQYQFRVKAVNKAGPGEPSEPTKSHTSKPRYCKHKKSLKHFNFLH